ncbi:AEC family transporter [Clostridium oceanicum]|uniref:AEC family transporter n=1 Tax=Clostridium oceanicum TaxID=1543 RepID=A0ABN1JSU5_9CLOT
MGSSNIVNQVLVLFFIMIVGVITRKTNILNKETNKRLSDLLVKVTLPCLIFSSFNYKFDPKILNNIKLMIFYSLIIHIVLIILSKILYFKYEGKVKSVLRYGTIFSNNGFMGYPIIEALYGKIGIFYASIFGIPYNIFMFSVGTMIYTGKRDVKTLKKAIIQPGVIATILGIIVFVFSIKIPSSLNMALSSVGSMTTPLSMIIVGSMLAEIDIKSVFSDFSTYYCSFVRLIIAPFLVYLLLKVVHADGLLLKICVVLEAMPVAVLCSVLAEQHDSNPILASKCVFITTVISIFTIPLIVSII